MMMTCKNTGQRVQPLPGSVLFHNMLFAEIAVNPVDLNQQCGQKSLHTHHSQLRGQPERLLRSLLITSGTMLYLKHNAKNRFTPDRRYQLR